MDLLESLIQRLTTLYNSQLRTHTSVHSHVSTNRCSVAASKAGLSLSSGFPNYPRPQIPSCHSYKSQRLKLSSSLDHSFTNQLFTNSTELNSTQIISNNSHQLTVLLIKSRKETYREHCFIIALQLLPWKHACLVSCYLATEVE
jgi:hypothetical protein